MMNLYHEMNTGLSRSFHEEGGVLFGSGWTPISVLKPFPHREDKFFVDIMYDEEFLKEALEFVNDDGKIVARMSTDWEGPTKGLIAFFEWPGLGVYEEWSNCDIWEFDTIVINSTSKNEYMLDRKFIEQKGFVPVEESDIAGWWRKAL